MVSTVNLEMRRKADMHESGGLATLGFDSPILQKGSVVEQVYTIDLGSIVFGHESSILSGPKEKKGEYLNMCLAEKKILNYCK